MAGIIRCKYCVHYPYKVRRFADDTVAFEYYPQCTYFRPDDFCSKAEMENVANVVRLLEQEREEDDKTD